MAFSFGEQRQLTDALLRIGHDAFEQTLEMPRHALYGGGIEQIARILPGRRKPCADSRTDKARSNLAL